jgi:hypothetical protein
MELNIVNKYYNLSSSDKNIYVNTILPTLKNDISIDIITTMRSKYNLLSPIINDTTIYTCQQLFSVSLQNKNRILSDTIDKLSRLVSAPNTE